MQPDEIQQEAIPMYQMSPTSLFSGRATDYAKYRPSYPAEAIATILAEFEARSQLVAADIGAGTGIAARLLADRGIKVMAIEPNVDMRLAATPHSLVEFRAATAEKTELPDASVDLITCFQSFHWFDPSPTLLEFRRILKSSGRLALIWGIWDENDEFTKKLDRLVLQASDRRPGLPDDESRAIALLKSSHFQQVRRTNFAYQQYLDLAGLIGLVQSQGFIPHTGQEKQRLIANLQKLYEPGCDRHGKVCIQYRMEVYLAQPKI